MPPTTSAAYANTQSRIFSGSKTQQRPYNTAPSSKLEHGVTMRDPQEGNLSPSKLRASTAALSETVSSTNSRGNTLRTTSGRGRNSNLLTQSLPALPASVQSSLHLRRGPRAGAAGSSPAGNDGASTSSGHPSAAPGVEVLAGGVLGAGKEGSAYGSRTAGHLLGSFNWGASSTRVGSKGHHTPQHADPAVARFLQDLSKTMGKVRAGQATMERMKAAARGGQPPYGSFLPPPAAANSHAHTQATGVDADGRPTGVGGARRGRGALLQHSQHHEERPIQVFTHVELPSAPQSMLKATGKASGAALLASVLEKGGYTRSDIRKIVDQLSQFQGWV